jgi:hypothetical protein
VNEAIIGTYAMAGTVETPQPVKAITVEPQVQPQPQPQVQPQFEQQASTEPPPQPARPDFLLPDSGSRRLNWNDIASLDGQQLRYARNEIYARRGRFMKDAQLRAYFSQFSWYKPWTWDVQLSAVEKANVALIQRAEAGQ